jgi:ClpX C4-type zinc finger
MDQDLLAGARQAEQRLIEAEHAADVARAEFHRAVRRLHLSGGSLRELAAALHLSHQRVHQIVESAGGGRRWRRPDRQPPDPELACSFCGRPQRKSRRLVAGPGVYICETCVELAEAVISSGNAAKTALGPLQPVPESATRQRCSFCGKHRRQVTGLATTPGNPVGKYAGDAAICAGCLSLCKEIHAEQLA